MARGKFRALTYQRAESTFLVSDDFPALYSLNPDGTVAFVGALDHPAKGLAVEHSGIEETTAATGLSGQTFASTGDDVQILRVGLTGDDFTTLDDITLTISDVGVPGVNTARKPASRRAGWSSTGIVPPPKSTTRSRSTPASVSAAATAGKRLA